MSKEFNCEIKKLIALFDKVADTEDEKELVKKFKAQIHILKSADEDAPMRMAKPHFEKHYQAVINKDINVLYKELKGTDFSEMVVVLQKIHGRLGEEKIDLIYHVLLKMSRICLMN